MRSLASISHLRKNSSHASPRVWSSSRSSVAQRGGGEVSGVLMRNGVVLAAILSVWPRGETRAIARARALHGVLDASPLIYIYTASSAQLRTHPHTRINPGRPWQQRARTAAAQRRRRRSGRQRTIATESSCRNFGSADDASTGTAKACFRGTLPCSRQRDTAQMR